MFLERNYPWNLKLTTFELGIVRKLLKDVELTPDEEAEASRLSTILEDVYERLATKKNELDLEASPPQDYVTGTQRPMRESYRGPDSRSHRLPPRTR